MGQTSCEINGSSDISRDVSLVQGKYSELEILVIAVSIECRMHDIGNCRSSYLIYLWLLNSDKKRIVSLSMILKNRFLSFWLRSQSAVRMASPGHLETSNT